MKVAELFMSLGFDVDDNSLKSFDTKIQNLNTNMWAAAASAAAAVYGIARFVDQAVMGANALKNFTMQQGLAQDKLQQWQVVGQMEDLNMSAETVTSSIISLQKHINDIHFGTGSTVPFNWLGIDMMHGQDAFDVLLELREKLQFNLEKFGRSKTTGLIQEMGLDPGFINALSLTREEFEKAYRGKVLSAEEIARLNDLGAAMRNLSLTWTHMTSSLSAHFAPILVKLIDWALPHIDSLGRGIMIVGDYMISKLPLIHDLLISFSPIIAMWAITVHPFITALGAIVWLLKEIGDYKPGDGGFIDTFLKTCEKIEAVLVRIKAMLPALWRKANDVLPWLPGENSKQTNETRKPIDESGRFLTAISDWWTRMDFSRKGGESFDYTGQRPDGAAIRSTIFNNTFNISGNTDPEGSADQVLYELNLQKAQEALNNGRK